MYNNKKCAQENVPVNLRVNYKSFCSAFHLKENGLRGEGNRVVDRQDIHRKLTKKEPITKYVTTILTLSFPGWPQGDVPALYL